jgi:multidrug resistance efflux pump
MAPSHAKKTSQRVKALGVILATVVAIGSLVLVALTQPPKKAQSSPAPADAAIVPQVADVKSEAEILLRGKSYAASRRNLIMHYPGVIDEIRVKPGDVVKKDQILASYTVDPATEKELRTRLDKSGLTNRRMDIEHSEIDLHELIDVHFPLVKLECRRVREELENLVELQQKGMAHESAVQALEDRIKAVCANVEKTEQQITKSKEQLQRVKREYKNQLENFNELVDVLEWRGGRSYENSDLPVSKAFIRSPIDGRVMYFHHLFAEGNQMGAGSHCVTVSPTGDMVIRCKVHELDLVKLRQGTKGTVVFDALPEKKFVCRVSAIPWVSRNPALEVPADYDIECTLEDLDMDLKEGLTCNVKVSVTQ